MLQEQRFHRALGPIVHRIGQQFHGNRINAQEIPNKHNIINFLINRTHACNQTYIIGNRDESGIRQILPTHTTPSLFRIHLSKTEIETNQSSLNYIFKSVPQLLPGSDQIAGQSKAVVIAAVNILH